MLLITHAPALTALAERVVELRAGRILEPTVAAV
jgi:predicted ABC-type transport system involved in lysophospholipase L1 biosynthesis ATPase subunit